MTAVGVKGLTVTFSVVHCSIVSAIYTVDGSILLVAVRTNSSCLLRRRCYLGSRRRHVNNPDC